MAGVLVLGPVVFQGFEVPERIGIGGRQRLAVHSLPGGGRIVDAMGPDDAPIRWEGMFCGPAAAARVRLLDGLLRAGAALPLAWDGWRFTVVIQTFEAHTESGWWMPYRLELCVVPDDAANAGGDALDLPTGAEAAVYAAGDGIDDRIAAASAGLQGADLGGVTAAAGRLARLVTARAFTGVDR